MSSHHLSLSEGDIISYIQGVCDSFLLMADKKQISFSFFPGVDHFTMAFDADKVGKIVMNLLSNAFKYTPEGGRVTVMVEHIQEDLDVIEIKVADSGEGISDADKEHIFDRFYQTENAETMSGTGIGLSLVHDFVTLHGGDVSVFDNIGKGTVFVVHLPVKHVDVQYNQHSSMPAPDLLSQTADTSAEEVDKSKFPLLLVVDDNDDFRHFMEYSLGLQYRVKLASNGKEAWNILQSSEEMPDLVVSDVMMPKKSGIELCKEIKDSVELSHVSVVLLTARVSEEYMVDGLMYGADGYIPKPFSIKVLLAKCESILANKKRLLSHYDTSAGSVSLSDTSSGSVDAVAVPDDKDKKFIDDCVAFIHANISDSELKADALASHFNISKSSLYKRFNKVVGIAPNEFILKVKFDEAMRLLKTSPCCFV